jgi:hypothetical protein
LIPVRAVVKPARSPRMPTPATLRRMQEDDLTLLHAWLQRPHIVMWWDRTTGVEPPTKFGRDTYRARTPVCVST